MSTFKIKKHNKSKNKFIQLNNSILETRLKIVFNFEWNQI